MSNAADAATTTAAPPPRSAPDADPGAGPTDRPAQVFRGTWESRLQQVIAMMRELSLQTDPQVMVQRYAARVRQITPNDGIVAISRRDVPAPKYRVTRSHLWGLERDPWKHAAELPVLEGGMLGKWLYGEVATVVDDLQVPRDDPAFEHLDGFRSAVVLPSFDEGSVKNMAVILKREPGYFQREHLPEQLWVTNLFGRVTHNLVLRGKIKAAYEAVDRELKVVGDIQRSLLPERLPEIPGLKVAAHYLTSRRAGGDYYDFFPLTGGRWGVFIADVAGHGTPAAVLMAVTHSIAHAIPGEPDPPSRLLTHVNRQLARRYTNGTGTFVTAFYGIYDPATRRLTYACAGHPGPRRRSCEGGCVDTTLDRSLGLPLGIDPDEAYTDATVDLRMGDVLVLYTDGITESRDAAGEMFGAERLDNVIACCAGDVEVMIRNILLAVEEFTDSAAPADDQTLIVARVE